MKRRITLIATILLFAGGFLSVLYPAVSEWKHHRIQETIAAQYAAAIEEKEDGEIEEELRKAREYNDYIRAGKVVLSDPFDETAAFSSKMAYESILNLDGSGVMGFIEIPQLALSFAIYHSTEDAVMSKGAGHLPGTSFPVGGQGTHAVLSSHRGLSTAKLFTDLDKLKIGDKFYIHVLKNTLAYKVDQIKVVKPEDISDLRIEDGKDYITLVTCTPYSINTHRLLVRGERIQGEADSESKEKLPRRNLPYGIYSLLLGIIALGGIFLILYATRKKRKA